MSRSLLVLIATFVVIASLCCDVSGFGTLYVNQIVANQDTGFIQVEGVELAQGNVRLASIQGWSGQVVINGITITDGSFGSGTSDFLLANILGSITATQSITTQGFVASSSGTVFTNGNVIIQSDLSVNTGNFQADASTHTVTIGDKLIADGGIDIDNGKFAVHQLEGAIVTSGGAVFENNLIFSSTQSSNIRRFATASPAGGNTIIAGQSAPIQAGNLIIEPGYAVDTVNGQNGQIVLGLARQQSIILGRSVLINSATAGGSTSYSGQSAVNGNGGHLFLSAGDGNTAGGSLYLSGGRSATGRATGSIILGSPIESRSNLPVVLTRVPISSNSKCGTTFINGQTSRFSNGGELIFEAGNSTVSNGGIVHLMPGRSTSQQGQIGSIFLGTSNNEFIGFGRFPNSAGSIAPLLIKGQDSFGGSGGDLYFIAGSASPVAVGSAAGPLYLSPGSSSGDGKSGQIILGLADHDLIVSAPQLATVPVGSLTFITGQQSTTSLGGSISITAGSGFSAAGSLYLSSGDSFTQPGSVTFDVTKSLSDGDIYITGGSSSASSQSFSFGGPVIFSGGSTTQSLTDAGDVIFDFTGGHITILPSTSLFSINQVSTVITSDVTIGSNSGSLLRISANPSSVISYNGQTLITSRPDELFLVLDVRSDTAENVSRLQDSLLTLINALGPCGHGLISYANPAGTPINTCLINQ